VGGTGIDVGPSVGVGEAWGSAAQPDTTMTNSAAVASLPAYDRTGMATSAPYPVKIARHDVSGLGFSQGCVAFRIER
jgi:hypothetical protein